MLAIYYINFLDKSTSNSRESTVLPSDSSHCKRKSKNDSNKRKRRKKTSVSPHRKRKTNQSHCKLLFIVYT